MSNSIVVLVEELYTVVRHQQTLLEILLREHQELVGRANVDVILEASEYELEVVKERLDFLKPPAQAQIFFKETAKEER